MLIRLLNTLFLIALSTCFATAQINPENIQIIRDKWGVPHIFGKTDPEVAYGLAYAHAEDDFKTMQLTLLAAKGMLRYTMKMVSLFMAVMSLESCGILWSWKAINMVS